MARLFFAVWPDERARAALERLSRDLAVVAEGKPTAPDKIHLTLAFLGEVPEERRAEALAVRLRRPAVGVRLDCVGSFRRARVAWAGSLEANAALEALQSVLAGELRERGFALEDRPFTAHVTLARSTRRPVPRAAIPPIEWRADELHLVRSNLGTGRYETVKAWSLG